jgi:hypothetical protein|tara:strand:- start:207 stop:632 length:426 start_codon:yes stop_codon:yes gene_type:complete
MGGSLSLNKINFEDVQCALNSGDATIISTLPVERQECLLSGTLSASEEVYVLNKSLSLGNQNGLRIVIYGENSCDDTLLEKCNQLIKLGFSDINVYVGGLFEWLLLQDIYGTDEFPTTRIEKDLLKFKGRKKMSLKMLTSL